MKKFLSQDDWWSLLSLDKFPVTGRNFLGKEDISCNLKKFPVTGRNFLLKEVIFFQIFCFHQKTLLINKYVVLEQDFLPNLNKVIDRGGNSDSCLFIIWSSCKCIHIMDCEISSLLVLNSVFVPYQQARTSTVSQPCSCWAH